MDTLTLNVTIGGKLFIDAVVEYDIEGDGSGDHLFAPRDPFRAEINTVTDADGKDLTDDMTDSERSEIEARIMRIEEFDRASAYEDL